jgi:hypothetical protein
MRWPAVTAAQFVTAQARLYRNTSRGKHAWNADVSDRHGCDEHDLEIFGEPACVLAVSGPVLRSQSVPFLCTFVLPCIKKPVYATATHPIPPVPRVW